MCGVLARMSRASLLLAAALALTQTACPAYLLSRIPSGAERVDRIAIPPEEPDARLQCGQGECAAVQLERASREGYSRTVFGSVLFVEALGAVGSVVGGVVVANSGNGGFLSNFDAVLASVPLLLLGTTLAATSLIDVAMYGANSSSYGRQYDLPRVQPPAFATWNGVQVPLDAADVWSSGTEPPARFSVARAVQLHLARSPGDRREVAAAAGLKGRLAVLDLHSYSPELHPENVRYFGDVLRGAALREAARYQVITRENLLALLGSSGKDLAACEGECEVETGRRVGADVIVTGEVQRVGDKYRLSFKLHETKGGRLLSTSIAGGATVDELDEDLRRAARELFEPLRN
jgi:hypothetical protein